MRPRTLALLEQLTSGDVLEPSQLDELLANRVKEDLHLDYKHGNELKKKDVAATTLRPYVSGFANSAGGVLIVGVDEQTWSVTGCEPPGGGTLTEWASRCLTPLAPYLAPPPRIFEVNHRDGRVLVLAVDRSAKLAPCIVNGEPVHHLRLGDQTLVAPPYLMTDLVLGRREHPVLVVHKASLSGQVGAVVPGFQPVRMSFALQVNNDGIRWAPHVMGGVITWAFGRVDDERIGHQLRSQVDLVRPSGFHVELALRHVRLRSTANTSDVDPFDAVWLRASSHENDEQAVVQERDYIVQAAIYVVARGSPPNWYQLTARFDASTRQFADVTYEPTWYARPRVSWQFA